MPLVLQTVCTAASNSNRLGSSTSICKHTTLESHSVSPQSSPHSTPVTDLCKSQQLSMRLSKVHVHRRPRACPHLPHGVRQAVEVLAVGPRWPMRMRNLLRNLH